MTGENNQIQQDEYTFLIYSYHTWGSYGQHEKVMKFLIDIDNKSQEPLWEVIANVKWINNDSRKNKHREAYVKEEDIKNLKGRIIKEVIDYQSSSRKEISVKYYIISDNDIQEINAERNIKINGKYYDVITLNDKKILVSKDEVLVQ
jgi:hypothetical protein